MLTSFHLHMKSRRVCIKTRSPPASLPLKGQGARHTTVKWPILGLQLSDKAAMLVVNTKEIFLLNLHQNRVHFPAEKNAFVLDHQLGSRDVTRKPAIMTGQIWMYSDPAESHSKSQQVLRRNFFILIWTICAHLTE